MKKIHLNLRTMSGKKKLVLKVEEKKDLPLPEPELPVPEEFKETKEEVKRRIHIRLRQKKKEQEEEEVKRGYTITLQPPFGASYTGAPIGTPVGTPYYGGAEAGVKEKLTGVIAGIAIPEIKTQVEELKERELEAISNEPSDLRGVNIKYPLMPSNPGSGERVFAYAHIAYDKRTNELVYKVVETELTEEEKLVLSSVKEYIEEKVDTDFSQIRKKDAISYIEDIFEKAIAYFKPKISDHSKATLRYYVFRDFVGLERIEPVLNDKYIEDISCDGVGIPLYIYHRNPILGSMKTNLFFQSGVELDSFVNKLSERCGRVISIARPLLDGTLPDGSRVQATLGSDIARRGSNFTIRMFTEEPITPVDVIRSGTCDARMMAYYWLLIEHGSSVLVSGGTATGKTSLLNALSLFIKPQMKIVSIEDTAELRLPHSHWIPEVARTPVSEEGKVDMFELLKESLRQRPDYIIVGEVRGKEAYVLFQQMAVGHPGLSTIHAENFSKLVDRLTSPPIELPPNLLENLDVIVFLRRIKRGRRYLRRVSDSLEVVGYDRKESAPKTKKIFSWDPSTDAFKGEENSMLLGKIATVSNMNQSEIAEEIEKRSKVLEWLVVRKITDYRKIAAIINLYYTSRELLLERLGYL